MEHHEDDLLFKAASLSRTFGGYLAEGDAEASSGNYAHYLTLLDGLTTADIWIVDRNAHTISVSNGTLNYDYNSLPAEAEEVIEQVFAGNVTTSESFSPLFQSPSITAGAPIRDENCYITAAMLLHSPIDGTQAVIREGLKLLLFASLIALAISVVCSVLLSMHFIRPIRAMQLAANHMAEGDYHFETGIHQKDELGALARDMDTLAMQLKAASEEAAKMEKLRQDFVSNVSHELRTPVTVLRSSLEALCDGVVSNEEQVGEYHRNMLSETLHLQRMISDLLELSRLQNPDFFIHCEAVDLCQVVSDSVRSAKQLVRAKCINLSVCVPEKEIMVWADEGRLRQMLLILIDNAIKFSCKNSDVQIVLLQQADSFALQVIDQGSGIREEDLPYIFDRFYTTTDTANPHGTGLGLSIAKEIAQRHHAQISASNRKEGGCMLEVLFPPMECDPCV